MPVGLRISRSLRRILTPDLESLAKYDGNCQSRDSLQDMEYQHGRQLRPPAYSPCSTQPFSSSSGIDNFVQVELDLMFRRHRTNLESLSTPDSD